jgi:4-diphosphocytidyl-2-C-methyl-D-erythritol kinase
VVLVLPDFGVSTKEAFAWFDASQVASDRPARGGSRHRTAPQQALVNDLEAPVVARHPEIGRIISALERAGASQAAMSGSGSAVFGLFSSRPAAIRAAASFASTSPRALVTRTLKRQTYQTLAAT